MIIRIIKKISRPSSILLLSLIILLSYPLKSTAEPALETPMHDSYTLKLFNQDSVLRNPNGTVYGYLELQPGTTVTDPAVLDLWYSYSPIVIPDISTMTVSLNGVPVSSRLLEPKQAALVNWQVPLPIQQFRPGVNEIGVSVVHRTIDGLCRDIDNEANWFIVRPETRISFRTIDASYALASYPRPFLNDYLASKINTVIYLPENPDKAMLSALLNLATSWGAKAPAGSPQRLEVRLGQPGQVSANEVVFVPAGRWTSDRPLSKDEAVLKLEQLTNGYNRLSIAGADDKSMGKAVNALNRPQLVKTFLGQQTFLSAPLPDEPASISSISSIARGKKGIYTLLDLGYAEDITVAGAFHQEAIINVTRPSNYSVGDGSYIELHFRHSKVLDPKKSAVTVYVNNIPMRSSVLTVENAEKGVLKVPIPESELNQPLWIIRFGFYHDLGIIDCSKRYDDVAWSVIDKKTNVYLAPGKIKRVPDLDDFPNNFYVSSNAIINLTMLLPEKPSLDEINAAFKVAYFVGHQNQKNINWDVQNNSSFDVKKAPGTVIAMGKNNQPNQWQALKEYLSVFPEANGKFYTAPWMDVLSESMGAFDIFQIAGLNSDEDKLLYAFMYSDVKRFNDLFDVAILKGSQLSGQVTLVDAQGNYATFKKQPEKTEKINFGILNDLLEGGAAIIYVAIFAAVILATIALMFFTRKRRIS